MKTKTFPDFTLETPYWQKGFIVIGIDEVGRGAFAGPLCVGGVVFSPSLNSQKLNYLLSLGINDSKKLSSKKRENLAKIIKKECLHYSISFIDVSTINKIGIGKATFLGMEQVANSINNKQKTKKSFLLIDAYEIPGISKGIQKGITYGDSLSLSIASASIIAKVERDKLMVQLGLKNPQYGWDKNKGYGTLKHREAIKKEGATSLHRVDFCRKVVQ